MLGEPMVDGSNPVCPWHWGALCLRDGNEIHLVIFAEERSDVGDVETAVEGCHGGKPVPAGYGKVQVIDMEVHDIEINRLLSDHLQHADVVGERVEDLLAFQAQGVFAYGTQLGPCH